MAAANSNSQNPFEKPSEHGEKRARHAQARGAGIASIENPNKRLGFYEFLNRAFVLTGN